MVVCGGFLPLISLPVKLDCSKARLQVGRAPVAHGGACGTEHLVGFREGRGHVPFVVSRLAAGAVPNGAIPHVPVLIS